MGETLTQEQIAAILAEVDAGRIDLDAIRRALYSHEYLRSAMGYQRLRAEAAEAAEVASSIDRIAGLLHLANPPRAPEAAPCGRCEHPRGSVEQHQCRAAPGEEVRERVAEVWARCPHHGPFCGGPNCCCADKHAPSPSPEEP